MDKSIKFEKEFWCADKDCPGHYWLAGVRHFHFQLNSKHFGGLVKGDVSTGEQWIRIVTVPDENSFIFIQKLPDDFIINDTKTRRIIMRKFLKKHAKELLAC